MRLSDERDCCLSVFTTEKKFIAAEVQFEDPPTKRPSMLSCLAGRIQTLMEAFDENLRGNAAALYEQMTKLYEDAGAQVTRSTIFDTSVIQAAKSVPAVVKAVPTDRIQIPFLTHISAHFNSRPWSDVRGSTPPANDEIQLSHATRAAHL